MDILNAVVTSLPQALLHGAITIILLVAGVFAYVRLTPYDDMKLIREGNVAASISLFSIIVGLAIPLSFCLVTVSTVAEILMWGIITVAIQLFAFKLCDWILNDLPRRIEEGEISAAVVLLAVKLATAFINSAMG